jgi:hypothetical protein
MSNKKMNLGSLKTLENKKFTQKKIIVGDFTILVDEVFRETKIIELVQEVLEKSRYMKENNIKMELSDFSYILFIKHFTDIDISDSFDEQIQFYNILVDLGYFETIINAFNQDEIKKFTEKMKVYKNNMDKLLEDLKNESDNTDESIGE